MKKKIAKLSNLFYPILALTVLVVAWVVFAKIVDSELIIPTINVTFNKLFLLLKDKTFYINVGNTLLRALQSFAISAAAAGVLALFSQIWKPFKRFLSPLITIMRAVPTMSVILLTVVWFSPNTSPIFVGFLIAMPILYSGFTSALDGVNLELIEMSKVYGVRKKDLIFSFYLPSVAPPAYDVMQSTASLTVKIVISAEVLAQTRHSMGIAMQIARGYLETAELLAWTLVAVLVSYLLELVIYGIKKSLVRW